MPGPGNGKRFVFPPDAAAYTYKGMAPADLPLPAMDWSVGICGVLKLVHPDATLNVDALLVMEDLVTVSVLPPLPLPSPPPLLPPPRPRR